MFPSATSTKSVLAGLAALAAAAIAASPAVAAPAAAPEIVVEPTFTVGTTNVLRWHPLDAGWSESGSKDRGYLVSVTNMSTGVSASHGVDGAGTDRLALAAFDLPGFPSVDGIAFRYSVQARDRRCVTKVGGTCLDWGGLNPGPSSAPTLSVQDATAPVGELELEAGALIVGTRDVVAGLAVSDVTSGPGSVQLSTSSSFPACPLLRPCVQDFAATVAARLAAGPDGQRAICARVFDRAAAPLGSGGGHLPPGASLPPGNASGALCDTILLDTTPPRLRVQPASATAVAGAGLALDATASDDVAGLGADSGIDAGTAVWAFGDGTTASGLAVTHVYARPGSFVARLRMRDRVGNEATLDVPVTVVPAPAVAQPGNGTPAPSTGSTSTAPTGAATAANRLSGVRVVRRGRQASVQFRLERPGRVIVTITRGAPARAIGRIVRNGRAGTNGIALGARFARPGRYVVTVAVPTAGLRRSVALRVR